MLSTSEFVLRLSIALVAGLIIGFERQWNHKASGLKTNMLVSIGSAIFVLLSYQVAGESGDITRIISQIVTGVGFLGAGVIFREGITVHGLTSAATIWCSAAIGCIAASGLFIETLICTLIVVVLNTFIGPIETWLKRRK